MSDGRLTTGELAALRHKIAHVFVESESWWFWEEHFTALLAHIDALAEELAAAERVVDVARKLKHPTSVYHWERFYNALDAYDAKGEHGDVSESDAG